MTGQTSRLRNNFPTGKIDSRTKTRFEEKVIKSLGSSVIKRRTGIERVLRVFATFWPPKGFVQRLVALVVTTQVPFARTSCARDLGFLGFTSFWSRDIQGKFVRNHVVMKNALVSRQCWAFNLDWPSSFWAVDPLLQLLARSFGYLLNRAFPAAKLEELGTGSPPVRNGFGFRNLFTLQGGLWTPPLVEDPGWWNWQVKDATASMAVPKKKAHWAVARQKSSSSNEHEWAIQLQGLKNIEKLYPTQGVM